MSIEKCGRIDPFWVRKLNHYGQNEKVEAKLSSSKSTIIYQRVSMLINFVSDRRFEASKDVDNFLAMLVQVQFLTKIYAIVGNEYIIDAIKKAFENGNQTFLKVLFMAGNLINIEYLSLSIIKQMPEIAEFILDNLDSEEIKRLRCDRYKTGNSNVQSTLNLCLSKSCQFGFITLAKKFYEMGGDAFSYAREADYQLIEVSPVSYAYWSGNKELCAHFLRYSPYRTTDEHNKSLLRLLDEILTKKDRNFFTLFSVRFEHLISTKLKEGCSKDYQAWIEHKNITNVTTFEQKLQRLVIKNDHLTLTRLLKRISPKALNDLLLFAIKNKRMDIAIILFRQALKLETLTSSFLLQTAKKALIFGLEEWVFFALKHGNFSDPNDLGQLLQNACLSNNPILVRQLIEAGAETQSRLADLVIHAMKSSIEILQLILDVVPTDQKEMICKNESILKKIRDGNYNIVIPRENMLQLVQFGFDPFQPYAEYSQDWYCFRSAATQGWDDVVEAALNHINWPTRRENVINRFKSFHLRDICKFEKVVVMLMRNGFIFDINDWNSRQALENCAKGGYLEALSAIMDGVDRDVFANKINAANALIHAVEAGHDDTAEFLIHAGANLNAKIGAVPSLYELACMKKMEKTEKIIRDYLIQCYEDGARYVNNIRISYPTSFLTHPDLFKSGKFKAFHVSFEEERQTFYFDPQLIAEASEYFELTFLKQCPENEIDEIYIEDIRPEVFKSLLLYILNGEKNFPYDVVKDLIELSKQWVIDLLDFDLEDWISNHPECGHWSNRMTVEAKAPVCSSSMT